MADTEWEPLKSELERLYVREGKALREVKDEMARKGFVKSNSSREFKKWNFRKYQRRLGAEEWDFIGKSIYKRKQRFGRDSEVYINGTKYSAKRLKKEAYGKAFVRTYDKFEIANGKSHYTRSSRCAASTAGMYVTWNESLPWLRFSKLLQQGEHQGLPSFPVSLRAPPRREIDGLFYHINRKVLQRLSSILPWDQLALPPNVHSNLRIAAGLSILMPEEFDGSHADFALLLCDSRGMGIDRLTLHLFLLSNNFLGHDESRSEEENDKHVLQMLRISGWNYAAHIRTLLSRHEPTIDAIIEKLYASALREGDLNIVRELLDAGLELNAVIPINRFGDFIARPVGVAATIPGDRGLKLIDFLLSRGGEINHLPDDGLDINAPLYCAVFARNEEMVRMFLSKGVLVDTWTLASAIEMDEHIDDELNIIPELIHHCPDLTPPCTNVLFNPLAQSVRTEKFEFVDILLMKGACVNEVVSIMYDDDLWPVSTVLGLTIQAQERQIIDIMLRVCGDASPKTGLRNSDGSVSRPKRYVSPLSIAVSTGDTTTTKHLLKIGSDIRIGDRDSERTLLERAATNDNLDLCKVLLQHGAMVDRPLSDHEPTTSAILIATKNQSFALIHLLIDAGARLDDKSQSAPDTVLAAAIETGNEQLIRLLQDSGATNFGQRVRRFGTHRTPNYVQKQGVLDGVLRGSGPGPLIAAIHAHVDDLAQFLIEHSVAIKDYLTFTGPKGDTALGAAILTDNAKIIQILLDCGARVTDYDLSEAVDRICDTDGDGHLLRRLLAHAVGLNAPTAVGSAIMHDREDLVTTMLESGISPEGRPQTCFDGDLSSKWALTNFGDPLSVLEIAALSNNASILQKLVRSSFFDSQLAGRALAIAILENNDVVITPLLDCRIDINQEIRYGFKGWAAVKDQRRPITLTLLARNDLDINHPATGIGGRTALQWAVENGDAELVSLLLNHGAHVDAPPAEDSGGTALQIAAIKGYIGIARRLIDLGANINAPPAPRNGCTALEGAATHGRTDLLHLLLDCGALVIGPHGEQQYQNAVGMAEQNGHHAASRLLRAFREQKEAEANARLPSGT
ncbi:ankyrin [Aspergillus insuetus]